MKIRKTRFEGVTVPFSELPVGGLFEYRSGTTHYPVCMRIQRMGEDSIYRAVDLEDGLMFEVSGNCEVRRVCYELVEVP